jgi:hypothetical protein
MLWFKNSGTLAQNLFSVLNNCETCLVCSITVKLMAKIYWAQKWCSFLQKQFCLKQFSL